MILIGMWHHHIYWNVASYLLEYVVISIGIYNHTYWDMLSYLLEYIIILIGICILFIGIRYVSYLFIVNSNSDKNYIQTITSIKFLRGISPNNSKNIDKLDVDPQRDDDASPMSTHRCMLRPT